MGLLNLQSELKIELNATELDQSNRAVLMQLEIEGRAALKKEKDEAKQN